MMPIVATGTSRWANTMQPCDTIPVMNVSSATTSHPRALSPNTSDPAMTTAIGPAVNRPSGIRHAMKSIVSTPVARARFDDSR